MIPWNYTTPKPNQFKTINGFLKFEKILCQTELKCQDFRSIRVEIEQCETKWTQGRYLQGAQNGWLV